MDMPAGSWTQTWPVVVPQPSPTILVGVQCADMPTDGQVGLQVLQPERMPPINIPLTPITSPNMTLYAQCDDWPIDSNGWLTVQYVQGPTAPDPQYASITPQAIMIAGPSVGEPMTFPQRDPDTP